MSTSQQSKRTLLGEKFLIGEELGRGAYGQVFKGMDTSTGDVVAIKQIGLSGVSQANLQGVMGEIDLLKTLNHNNIVKYIGSFKTRNHLYIILEFMENGALSSVIKPNRFGVFPETLVAIYIAQVLQGLAYLHDQGVVHRDIKGANILTTKDVSSQASSSAAVVAILSDQQMVSLQLLRRQVLRPKHVHTMLACSCCIHTWPLSLAIF